MTPLQTRQALLEIPERLEQLRFGETASNDLADEPIAANILNPTIVGSLNNSFNSVSSSVQSPDEIVIRQRGRRRISLTWSPDKCSTSYSLQKTPTKINGTSMILRSSPRKRLMLNESSNSPKTNDNETVTPVVKRMKYGETSVVQMNATTPLPVMLKGLTQNQLIEIIKDMIRIEPHLEEKIRNEFPYPDLRYNKYIIFKSFFLIYRYFIFSSYEDQLNRIKKNIYKSLPSSRLSQKTDSIAYSRASIHISEFKKQIISHCRILNESKNWHALIDYIIIAWQYVRGTPIWENDSHNETRRQCFRVLSCHCKTALNFAGIHLGKERLRTLLTNIQQMSKDYENIKSCTSTINQILDG